MEYRAPDKKTFVTTSESGSGSCAVWRQPADRSEIEAASESNITIAPSPLRIYTFELLGEQQVGPYHCFVVRADAKTARQSTCLKESCGIDTQDFAVVRIAGHPAKKTLLLDRTRRLRARVSKNRWILAFKKKMKHL